MKKSTYSNRYSSVATLLLVLLFSQTSVWAGSPYPEPLMGAQALSIYDDLVKDSVGAADYNGVYLQTVPAASYAATQGFLSKDVILSINGVDITDKQSFWLMYNIIEPGTSINIKRLRNQVEKDTSFVKMIASEQLNSTAGVVYTGNWTFQEKPEWFYGNMMHSKYVANYFEIQFYGTGISLVSQLNTGNTPEIEVWIDGVVSDTVSSQGAKTFDVEIYSVSGLAEGVHTLKAVNLVDLEYLILDAYTILFDPLSTNIEMTSEVDESFKVYPNPAAEYVMIETATELATVSIYGMDGKLLLSQKASGNSLRLDLPDVNHPSLLVNVVLKDGSTLTKKVMR